MKMKKLFLTIVVVALLLSTTVVMAASESGKLSVDKTEYKKGDTVTVTLTVPNVQNANGALIYDNTSLKFVGVSTDAGSKVSISAQDNGKDGVDIFAMPLVSGATFSKVTYTFEVISENEGTLKAFSVGNDFVIGNTTGAVVDTSAIAEIKINPQTQPQPPQEEEQPPKEEEPSNPSENTPSTKPGTDTPATDSEVGNSGETNQPTSGTQANQPATEQKAPTDVPSSIPQAGIPFVAIGFGLVAIVVLATVVVKSKRK